MKKRITAMALAFVMVLGTVAAAAGTEKTISVTPMTMTINGQSVTPQKSNGTPAEVFAYDGATYVPLRYLSELLGIDVEWDKNDPNTARLVSDKLTVPAASSGTFTGKASGFGGEVSATITVADGKITACKLVGAGETPAIGGAALPTLETQVTAAGSAAIDGVAGATVTSTAVKEAVAAALAQMSGADTTSVGKMTPGDYTVTTKGHNGELTVTVTVSDSEIKDVKVGENEETYGIGYGIINAPLDVAPGWIVANQSLAFDAVSGATVTSKAIVTAVAEAVTKAGGNAAALKAKTVETTPAKDETITCDVVVAGAGAAGLAAGLAALEEGADVVIVEKQDIPGGSTTRCGGYFLAAGTEMQKKLGVKDSAEQLWEEMEELGGKTIDKEKVKAFCYASADTFEWIVGNGARFSAPVSLHKTEPIKRVHSTDDSKFMGSGLGGPMTVPLTNTFIEKGGKLLCSTPAEELILDQSGNVAGLKCTRADGSTLTVNAKSVILATGGYTGDEERWSKLEGKPLSSSGTAGNTADAEKMVAAVNGQVYNDPRGNVTMVNPNTGVGCFGDSSLLVTPAGERFINEHCYFYRYTEAVIDMGFDHCWYITDKDDPSPYAQFGTTLESIPHAATAKELAAIIGVDGDALEATIAQYNKMCAAGKDTDFGKPAEYLNALDKELYALKMVPSISGTYGGVMTDANSRVLDNNNKVVANLYAAGEAAFCGLIGEGGYPMCGTAVGTAMYFGRLAGQQAGAAAGK